MTAAILLDPDRHPVIGHRGASGLAPENTLPSFDLAIDQGADALEFDVRLTADGVPVVCHDATIDRTTDATGAVLDRTVSDLHSADAGARFPGEGKTYPYRGRGVTIPRLSDVLNRYRSVPFLIELKVAAAIEPVRRALVEAGAADRAVVASFLPEVVDGFTDPPFRAGASQREIRDLWFRASVGLEPRPTAVSLYAVPDRYKGWLPVPTRRVVAAARRARRPVHVWTVNEVAEAESHWDRGVAGIISNFPGLMVAARNRRFG